MRMSRGNKLCQNEVVSECKVKNRTVQVYEAGTTWNVDGKTKTVGGMFRSFKKLCAMQQRNSKFLRGQKVDWE